MCLCSHTTHTHMDVYIHTAKRLSCHDHKAEFLELSVKEVGRKDRFLKDLGILLSVWGRFESSGLVLGAPESSLLSKTNGLIRLEATVEDQGLDWRSSFPSTWPCESNSGPGLLPRPSKPI